MYGFYSVTYLLYFFISEQLPEQTSHLPELWHRAQAARQTERHHQKTSGVVFILFIKSHRITVTTFSKTSLHERPLGRFENVFYIVYLCTISSISLKIKRYCLYMFLSLGIFPGVNLFKSKRKQTKWQTWWASKRIAWQNPKASWKQE